MNPLVAYTLEFWRVLLRPRAEIIQFPVGQEQPTVRRYGYHPDCLIL